MKKAAVYARYSSNNQKELSIESQLERIEEYCERHNMKIVKRYIDRAISASLIEKRLDFLKLIEDATEAKFDYVIVWDFKRFARTRLDARKYKELLNEYGIKVISVSEPGVSGPESILLEGVSETYAEYEVARLAKDTMRGMLTKAKRGAFLGGLSPFGYKKVQMGDDIKLYPDEKEAKIVQKMFQMRAQKCTYTEIAKYANKMGYTTRRGQRFTIASVKHILGNPKYKGVYIFNDRKKKGRFNPFDEIVRVHIPEMQIVDSKLWQRVQSLPGVQKKSKIKYLLRGLLYCSECKYPMAGSSYGKGAGGCYICQNCKKKHGKYYKIGKDKIENRVVEYIEKYLNILDATTLTKKINEQIEKKKETSRMKELHDEIQEKKNAISNITKAVESGVYSQALLDRLSKLEKEKEELTEKLTNLRMRNISLKSVSEQEVSDILTGYKHSLQKYEMKYMILHDLIDTIAYYHESKKIKITSAFGVDTLRVL